MSGRPIGDARAPHDPSIQKDRDLHVALYPLLLEPIYKEKVWGGRALERLGRTLPGGPETTIGESWELADLATTSPSGGGGEAAHSRIRNGPLRERPLDDVLRDFGSLLLGRSAAEVGPGFPLLLKYLDARENLSVQVHPSPGYAAEHPEAHLKSEAWYVIDAEPDAVIYKGIEAGTTPEALEAAIADGSLADLLIRVPARPGDCHYLPSGTCHALGGGILVAEVQTPSDTTFRVFDWGRTDRELHVEQALACIDFGPVDAARWEPGSERSRDGARGRDLVACEHFSITEWTMSAGDVSSFVPSGPTVVMLVSGEAVLRWGSDDTGALGLRAADTVLLPDSLSGADLHATEDTTLLEVTLPAGASDGTATP